MTFRSGLVAVVAIALLAACDDGGSRSATYTDAATATHAVTTAVTTFAPTTMNPPPSATTVSPTKEPESTTSIAPVSSTEVVSGPTTTDASRCELKDSGGPLLEAVRTRSAPYFLRHPAEPGPDTSTVMFLPGGSTGSRRAAERVWANYLSGGDGVDEFRLVIPFAEDFDLIDDISRLLDIVTEVLACHGGDPQSFHIAGYSQGGQIAYGLMLREPELFATLLGAPGEFRLIEPERWRDKLAGKAVFNGVGENDEDWKVFVKQIHEGLVEAGVESVYVEFPGEGHRISAEFDESIFFDFWSSH